MSMDETTNIDMAAERAARATKTELEMENVRLRRLLMEAEQRIGRLGRTALGGRERRILKMWPRYEDTGDCVMPGDRVALEDGSAEALCQLHIGESCYSLYTETHDEEHPCGERVKRPVPEVVDENGVPFRTGDKVYDCVGNELTVKEVNFDDDEEFPEHTVWCGEYMHGHKLVHTPDSLTHARPDSWERLEEDAAGGAKDYCAEHGIEPTRAHEYGQAKALDLVCRAKALAGVE